MKLNNIATHWLFTTLVIACFSCTQPQENTEPVAAAEPVATASEPAKPVPPAPIDKNKISGNWVRTDAPYNLKIADVSDSGTMKAEYFNPKSIHVGKATWITDVNGAINLYVELRDVNYPGSNYTLFYVPDKDLLAGKYFQAMEGQTYDVGFTRGK